jgi:hypothetical protein
MRQYDSRKYVGVKSFYLVYFSFWLDPAQTTRQDGIQHGGPWFTADRAALHYDWVLTQAGKAPVNFPNISDTDRRNIKTGDREAQKRYYESQGASCYHGVSWRKNRKKWEARTRHNGKIIYLGSFEVQADAARAYDNYVIHHNLQRKLNFPELLLTNSPQCDKIEIEQ